MKCVNWMEEKVVESEDYSSSSCLSWGNILGSVLTLPPPELLPPWIAALPGLMSPFPFHNLYIEKLGRKDSCLHMIT